MQTSVSPAAPDDWVWIAHHKTGTKVAEELARVLCRSSGRRVAKNTWREPPRTKVARGLCHLVLKLQPQDIARWTGGGARIVHLVRDPAEMVTSGYLYHRRGSEPSWTNSTLCSRDLCQLPDAAAATGDKFAAQRFFNAMPAAPWLRLLGCPPSARTYLDCLQTAGLAAGLAIETRRAAHTIETMLALQTVTHGPGSRTRQLELRSLERASFNATFRSLAAWLEHPARGDTELLARARRLCFGGGKVLTAAHATRGSPSRAGSPLAAAARAWASNNATPALRELSARSGLSRTWPHVPPLFSDTAKDRAVSGGGGGGGRGVLTCSAPRLLDQTLAMLTRLRATGCALPAQIWHVGELGQPDSAGSRRLLAARAAVRDLREALHPALPPSELGAMRGFMCKPLAVLATDFDEVLPRHFLDTS